MQLENVPALGRVAFFNSKCTINVFKFMFLNFFSNFFLSNERELREIEQIDNGIEGTSKDVHIVR